MLRAAPLYFKGEQEVCLSTFILGAFYGNFWKLYAKGCTAPLDFNGQQEVWVRTCLFFSSLAGQVGFFKSFHPCVVQVVVVEKLPAPPPPRSVLVPTGTSVVTVQ